MPSDEVDADSRERDEKSNEDAVEKRRGKKNAKFRNLARPETRYMPKVPQVPYTTCSPLPTPPPFASRRIQRKSFIVIRN